MLEHLSGVLRSVLASGASPERPLVDELELTRAFLRIHEVRFGARLEVSVESDAECDRALTPTLLLQPLVENAVVHGASCRPGSTRVTVSARRAADRLEICVRDTGVAAATPAIHGHRTGLATTRQRLAHHYGSAFDLVVDVSPLETTVTVSIPFRFPRAA